MYSSSCDKFYCIIVHCEDIYGPDVSKKKQYDHLHNHNLLL